LNLHKKGANILKHVINTKELRASLSEIVKKVQRGDQYTVFYRSHPAFRIIGVNTEETITCPLSDDPLFRAESVGASSDGLSGIDHDATLYGK
jgi:prevent-host-death family protein